MKPNFAEGPSQGGLDIIQLVLFMWQRRKWVAVCTFLATLIGVAIALLATPVYYSEATIAQREQETGGNAARLLAQFGGLGGPVASQLGAATSGVTRMKIFVESYEVAENVIQSHNLMPMLFPKDWDSATGAWKPKSRPKKRTLARGVKILREKVLSASINLKNRVLTIGTYGSTPAMARQLTEFYLDALNKKIRFDVMSGADMDRAYLEKQLEQTLDPVLRERVQGMIAHQIEKSMLVSSQAFDLLEKPVEPLERSSPKRKKIVILSFLIGLFGSIAGMFAVRGVRIFREAVRRRISASSAGGLP